MKKRTITSMLVACAVALALAGLGACGSGSASGAGNASSANETQSIIIKDGYPDLFRLWNMSVDERQEALSDCYRDDSGTYAPSESVFKEWNKGGSLDKGEWILRKVEAGSELELVFGMDGNYEAACRELASVYELDAISLRSNKTYAADAEVYRQGQYVGDICDAPSYNLFFTLSYGGE